MKKIVTTIIMGVVTLGFSFADVSIGSTLKAYEIITQTQLSNNQSEIMTRNELYILLNQMTKNLTTPVSKSTYTDILPNSNFQLIAQKMTALGLVLPDQLAGTFKPSKQMTYEEVSLLCLRLTGYNGNAANVLNTAYDAGLLKGVRIMKLNQTITKQAVYQLLENTLAVKRVNSDKTVAEYLGLINSETGSKPATQQNASGQPFKMEMYNKETLFISFDSMPSQTAIEALKIINSKGEVLEIAKRYAIDGQSYLFTTTKALNDNELYRIDGSNITTIATIQAASTPLFCIEEESKSAYNKQIKLRFNRKLDVSSALNLENFTVRSELTFDNIKFDRLPDGSLDLQCILIETSPQTLGRTYIIELQPGLKDSFGVGVSPNTAYRQIVLYGTGEDIYPPKVGKATAMAINQIKIQFEEGTLLETKSAENLLNYTIYSLETQKKYNVLKAELKKNEMTDNYTDVILTVEPMDRLKRYMVEAVGIKDVGGNELTVKGNYRASFALTETEETAPKLIYVESFSKELLKLVFNKSIIIPANYSLENIQMSPGLKPLSLTADSNNKTILWLKTTEHQSSGISIIKTQDLTDNFGNTTTFSLGSQYYSPTRLDAEKPVAGLIDNNKAHGKNVITVNFTKAMDTETLENQSNYKIDGIDILYVYQTTDHQVKLVTGPQRQGQIYTLNMTGLTDQFGTPLDQRSESKAFIGLSID